jgi:hypothetical protein
MHTTFLGAKYKGELTVLDIAKLIRKDLKAFNDKYVIKVKSFKYSAYEAAIKVTITDFKEPDYIVYMCNWSDLTMQSKNTLARTLGKSLAELFDLWNKTGGEDELNKLTYDSKLFYSKEVLQDFKSIDNIVHAYRRDSNEVMTDFFSCNFMYQTCEIELV